MNYSRTILWLGLALIALNLVKDWSTVKSTIFTKSSKSTAQPFNPLGGFSSLSPLTDPWAYFLPGLIANQNPNPAQTPTTVVV